MSMSTSMSYGYGFELTNMTKELFIKLISVKGLGCKMALPILTSSL